MNAVPTQVDRLGLSNRFSSKRWRLYAGIRLACEVYKVIWLGRHHGPRRPTWADGHGPRGTRRCRGTDGAGDGDLLVVSEIWVQRGACRS